MFVSSSASPASSSVAFQIQNARKRFGNSYTADEYPKTAQSKFPGSPTQQYILIYF